MVGLSVGDIVGYILCGIMCICYFTQLLFENIMENGLTWVGLSVGIGVGSGVGGGKSHNMTAGSEHDCWSHLGEELDALFCRYAQYPMFAL